MKPITLNSTRPASPLSATQWRTLEDLAGKASAAIQDLELALLFAVRDSEDAELRAKIFEQIERLKDAECKVLPAYFYHPQPEWLGGDSSDLNNHRLREPAIMGMRRATVL